MKQEEKDLTEWIPKELADPRTHTISLEPIKQILEEREVSKDDLLQTYKDENERLQQQIEEMSKEQAQNGTIKLFWKTLSLYCNQTNTRLNILQCSNRYKKRQCKGCLDRDAILSKLEARNR